METGIDNLGKIWVKKSTAMIELNIDMDIKNNKKNFCRYAGVKRKSRDKCGPFQEGNWTSDYLGHEEDCGTQQSSASIFTSKYASHITWVAQGKGRGWENKEL